MTDIEEFDEQLQQEMGRFEQMISQISSKSAQQRANFIMKVTNVQKSISTLIESYDMELNNLSKAKAQEYQSDLQHIQSKFHLLKNQFQMAKTNPTNSNDLTTPLSIDVSQMNQGQSINYATNLQQKGLNKLDNALNRIEETKAIGNDISQELDRQIQSLDRMSNKVKDTQGVLKRTQKHLDYFAKEVVKDKMIMGCITLILLAVLMIIIFSALSDSSQNTHNSGK